MSDVPILGEGKKIKIKINKKERFFLNNIVERPIISLTVKKKYAK
jgi:hypothetical protein